MKQEISPGMTAALLGLVVALLVGSFFLWDRQKRQAQSERIEATIRAGAGGPQPPR